MSTPQPPGNEPPGAEPTFTRNRLLVLALAFVLLAGVAVGYTVHAVAREDRKIHGGHGTAPGTVPVVLAGPPRLLFRSTQSGPGYGHVATVPLADPGGPRTVGSLMCERVYAAGGTAVCLTTEHNGVTRSYAVVLDADLHEERRIEVAGTPNRARVSASGRLVAWTVFVYGDSYAATTFSTRTSILDLRTGTLTPSLESFTAYRDGTQVHVPDLNLWGVTFAADDNTFYATLSSATLGGTFLVRGDLSARTVTLLRSNVECPSLSPDGTRIVFKKKVSGDPHHPWHLAVLDLATGRETPLAEQRSVDDQAEWLDNDTVAYALPSGAGAVTDIWAVPADGTGTPRLLVPGGFSPVALG